MVGWTEYLFGHLGVSAPRQHKSFGRCLEAKLDGMNRSNRA